MEFTNENGVMGSDADISRNSKFQVPASIFAEPNMDTVKRSLTLNVADQQHSNGTASSSLGPSLQTPQLNMTLGSNSGLSPGTQLLRAHNLLPQMLESPDLKMLALGSPELECMLAVFSPMQSPFGSVSRAAGGNAEEMDFVSALNELYQRSRQATPDKVSPRGANQWSLPASTGAANDAENRTEDSGAIVRPVPYRPNSSLGTSKLAVDNQEPRTTITMQPSSAIVDAAKRLNAAAQDIRKFANTSKTTIGTPSDDTAGLRTLMLLDTAQTHTGLSQPAVVLGQPSTVLNAPGIVPLTSTSSTLLIPNTGQPGTVLLTALPSALVQLTSLPVLTTDPSFVNNLSQATQSGVLTRHVTTNASDDDSSVAAAHQKQQQQQSAISSSSNSKTAKRNSVTASHTRRRKVTESDSSANQTAQLAASSSNRSSPVAISSNKKTKSTRSQSQKTTADEKLNSSGNKRARGDSNAPRRSAKYNDNDDLDSDLNDDDDDEQGQSYGGLNASDVGLTDDKLSRKRERNRLAAQRCRERKVKRIGELQTDVAKLEDEKAELRQRIAELTHTVDNLQRRITKHERTGCLVAVLSPSESQAIEPERGSQSE